jgi:hypothetical protein
MTCSDVQRVLPELLDGASDGALPTDINAHVNSCPDCSDLVSDLKLISSEARKLAAADEPAPRLWVKIAAELRAEGLIRDSAIGGSATGQRESARPILVPVSASPRSGWSAWWLAPVAAALLAAGSYMVSHKAPPQVATNAPATQVQATPADAEVASATPPPAPAQQFTQKTNKPTVTAIAPPTTSTKTPAESGVETAVESAPSAEDQQFLSFVSTSAPSLRATYESQLKAVNADIRETQAYVDRNPGDADARQHLMDAYEQKALLYQLALDRIQ